MKKLCRLIFMINFSYFCLFAIKFVGNCCMKSSFFCVKTWKVMYEKVALLFLIHYKTNLILEKRPPVQSRDFLKLTLFV